MNLGRVLYIFVIPIGALALDIWMRWKIKKGREEENAFDWEDWCYGPDLVVDGFITTFASLAGFKAWTLEPLGGVLVLLLFAFVVTIDIHRGLEPQLGNGNWVLRWRARLLVAGFCNVLGLAGLTAVLWLLWQK